MFRVEYDNDVGPMDEGYAEWWEVTDDKMSFRTDTEADAEWLCEVLNAAEAVATLLPSPVIRLPALPIRPEVLG